MMKKSNKTKILAGFLFSMIFLTLFMQNNINFLTDNDTISAEEIQEIQNKEDTKEVKNSAVITDLIRINASADGVSVHNWTSAQDAGIVSAGGLGTQAKPYIIENKEINGQNIHGGIEILDSRGPPDIYFRIENNLIYNVGSLYSERAGIKLFKTQYGDIRNNVISSSTEGNYGIHVVGYMEWGTPFHMDTSKKINITGNTITDTYRGIYIEEGSQEITVSENNIKDTSYAGISIAHRCVKLTIIDNTISENNGYGIYDKDSNNHMMPDMEPTYTDSNLIKNNTICNNAIGLQLSKTKGSTVSYNNISSNTQKGIVIKGASWNYIANNTISDNQDYGIEVKNIAGLSWSFRNRIYNNKFLANGEHAIEQTSPPPFWVMGGYWENNWSWYKTGITPPLIGNYWDNYTELGAGAVDADDDAVGDIPYIFTGNQDDRPIFNDGIEGHVIFINDSGGLSPYSWDSWAKDKFWCTGQGWMSDPFVIGPNENWDGVIDAWGEEAGITIVTSVAWHFRIEGVTIINSSFAGIKLSEQIGTGAVWSQIKNNNISFNDGHGIYVSRGVENVNITDNYICNNSDTGIYLYNNTGTMVPVNIIDNTITGNGDDGIYIEENVDGTLIKENTIAYNGRYGVNINETTEGWNGGCNDTTVYNNDFKGNGINANDNGTDTIWYLKLWGEQGRGNFWADYKGWDGDDDGIGDDNTGPLYKPYPYNISGSSFSQDRYPIWDDGFKEDALYIDADATGVGAHNWTWASRRLFITGSGTSEDPYIIQNVRFNGADTTSPITIKNSDEIAPPVYFKIINCTLDNIGGVQGGSAGVYLYNTINGEIINCTYTTNFNGNYGIFLDNECWEINITDNTIENDIYSSIKFKYGIYLDKSGFTAFPNFIDGNIIKHNFIGIFLRNSSWENNILNNQIIDNKYTGINSNYSCQYNNIYDNDILRNDYGIMITNGSTNNDIYDNEIRYNTIMGLYINTSINKIYNNYFDNPLGINAQDDTPGAKNMNSYFQWDMELSIFRGNFWSEYIYPTYSVDVKDADDDGIGDIYYNVTGLNEAEDMYPIFDDGHNGSRVVIDGSLIAGEPNSWQWTARRTWCTGSGTPNDPYIISGLVINAQLKGSGIYIYSSNQWDDPNFIIRDCIIYNSSDTESPAPAGGIHLWKVNNATIINNTIYNNDGHGIVLECGVAAADETSNIIIQDNLIKNNNGTGIYLNGSFVHENLIDNNTINSNAINGISIFDGAHDTTVINNILYNNTEIGISVVEFQPMFPVGGHYEYPPPDYLPVWVPDPWDYNKIINNTITLGDTGIGLEKSKLVEITGNYITQTISNGIATKDFESKNLTITGNTIYDNDQYGINIGWDVPSFTEFNYILNNNISNNAEAGIIIQLCFNSIFSHNTFDENGVGIGLSYSSSNNEFTENNITDSTNIGFSIDDDECERNYIYNNSFIGNIINAEDSGVFTQWYLDALKLGNYWDDYTGRDPDDDGIGGDFSDINPVNWKYIPYNITGEFVDSVDLYPIFWDAPVLEVADEKPKQGQQYEKESPEYHIIIKEGFGFRFWYNVNGTLSKDMPTTPEFLQGKIDPLIWETFNNGTITITFYVNDSRNEVDPISVVITKLIMPGDGNGYYEPTKPATDDDDDDTKTEKEEEGLPWWLQAIFTGIISASAGLIIKISYSAHKRRKELYRKISDNLDRVDNIEKFLQDRLGFEDWNKLKESLKKYQKNEISSKQLVKQSKKSVGKKFMHLFVKPKPKKKRK